MPTPTIRRTRPAPPAVAEPDPPLWDGYCADPFVLRADDGRYVMYGTTPSALPDGRAFQVLVSDDLDHLAGRRWGPRPCPSRRSRRMSSTGRPRWPTPTAGTGCTTPAGAAMPATRSASPAPPAPPVRSRTPATSSPPTCRSPSTPRRTATPPGRGGCSTPPTSSRGTGPARCIAVQRLRDMTHLEGPRTVVLRASADWQRYQRDREIYGGIHDWHTLEGPAVARRRQRRLHPAVLRWELADPRLRGGRGHRTGTRGPVARGPRRAAGRHQRQHRADRAGALQRPRRRRRRAPPLPARVGPQLHRRRPHRMSLRLVDGGVSVGPAAASAR